MCDITADGSRLLRNVPSLFGLEFESDSEVPEASARKDKEVNPSMIALKRYEGICVGPTYDMLSMQTWYFALLGLPGLRYPVQEGKIPDISLSSMFEGQGIRLLMNLIVVLCSTKQKRHQHPVSASMPY